MRKALITILMTATAGFGLTGCALTSEGAGNRVDALLDFAGKQPLNDRFYDPVFYDEDYAPLDEFEASLQHATEVQKREEAKPHIKIDEFDIEPSEK